MNKELEELDRENWELLSAVKYFREAYTKLREENKRLAHKMQELEQLQKDYLLDHRDDDENTIPLIQQIRDRLDLVDELEAEKEQLRTLLLDREYPLEIDEILGVVQALFKGDTEVCNILDGYIDDYYRLLRCYKEE